MASRVTVRTAALRLLLFLPWLVLGLAGGFTAGVLAEVHTGPEPSWLALLLWYALPVLWAAIAVALALGEARWFLASVLLGAFLMSLVFTAGVLGNFFPYAAGLGDRQIDSYGGEMEISSWRHWLAFSLAFSGMVGALFGAFGGFLSWVSRFLLRPHMEEE
jgi:hypothetical protein